MSHDITELRDILFTTLRNLADPEKTVDLDRANAIRDLSQTVINSAKVEVDYLKQTGRDTGTGFLGTPAPACLPDGIQPPGLTGTVRHLLRG